MNKQAMTARILWAIVFLFSGYSGSYAQSTTPDPGLIGPHTVIKAEYNLGDTVYLPPPAAMYSFTPTADVPSLKMEVAGCVHYPSDLSGGPYPVIIFLHGMHETCFETADHNNTALAWPCPTGYQSITSYEGYDYLANNLASHGYIVISISSNAINAINNSLADYGMNARGVLVQHHLDLWNTWNTTGGAPFGTTFVGALNMQKVGTMGHSRGGEGVVYNYQYNATLGNPYGIKAVLPLAPVDFFRHVINNVALMDVAPYCDGDVNDLQGLHFYDDARYLVPTDEAPKHTVLFMGANHDFFNTVWTPNPYIGGGADDWGDYGWSNSDPQCGSTKTTRFDTTKQKAALNAYLPAFFRLYLGNESQFAPILEVKDILPPASTTLDTTNVFVSYQPGVKDRVDVNRTDALTRLTTNTLAGTVTESGFTSSEICGGGLTMPDCNISGNAEQKPHNGDASNKGLAQMGMQWSGSTDYYENDIPQANENLSAYEDLMFRAAVNFKFSPKGPNLDFTVQLIDSAGNVGSQQVSQVTHVMFYQPGTEATDLPKQVMNTVHLPLSGFSGVNLSKIRHIKFLFDKSAAGSILISDLSFTNPVCGNFTASMKDSIGKLNKAFFTTTAGCTAGDTIAYYWNFGDPASGLSDTSTLPNPSHTYSVGGTFHPCVAVIVKRNGVSAITTCADTFCTTITVFKLGVNDLSAALNNISVIPNPAKDYLQVEGASSTDMLHLVNLYGQVVLTTQLGSKIVHLPATLASGVYTAIVTTDAGNVYKKIVVTR